MLEDMLNAVNGIGGLGQRPPEVTIDKGTEFFEKLKKLESSEK